VSLGPLKTVKLKIIPGQAGQVVLFPSTSGGADSQVHTILSEIRMEEDGELIIEDGVDLLVAESSTSCYLMVSGVIRYEV
jgi:hypothetical protein